MGNTWFNPKFITNIFGFLYLIDLGYNITYDSRVEDAFACKHPDFYLVKFVRTKDVYKPTKNYIQDVQDTEATSKSEEKFEAFMEDAGAIAKIEKNFKDSTENAEAMPKF